ncbi:MAG: hypothetical protein Q7J98_06620 [Kiritimatiellia bacterium]|nr:hypothetical protein [Kiritimatiellia bacterium]
MKNLGPETMAFFQQGAGGDVNEIFGEDFNNRRRTNDFGIKLGQSVLEGWRKITTGPAKLKVVAKNIEFPFRTDIPSCISTLKQEQAMLMASLNTSYAYLLSFKEFIPLYLKYSLNPDYPSHLSFRYMQADECGDNRIKEEDERNRLEIRKYLDRIRTMERMTGNELKISMLKKHQEVIDEIGTTTIPAEIQGIKIGECVFITAPMEILVEVGFNVKKMSPFKHTYITSISNGYLHYAPPASYYRRGGYEVTECLLDPGWEDIFYNVVRNIFNELNK